MAKKILNIATFGLAGALLGGKKKKKAEPAPEPAPAVMPVADDEAIRQAKKRSIAAQMKRSGRSSTILSSSSETLGA